MARYIELDALVAEIEKIEKSIGCDRFLSEFEKGCNQGEEEVCDTLRCFLNTLEVKEVDLDFTKEVVMWVRDNGDTNGFFNVQDLAKHFFELGLKSQKGE